MPLLIIYQVCALLVGVAIICGTVVLVAHAVRTDSSRLRIIGIGLAVLAGTFLFLHAWHWALELTSHTVCG